MTDTELRPRVAVAARPAILSRALVVRFVSIAASSIGFFLPLSALPAFAERQAEGAGGLTNGALLVACVIGELLSPWVMARIGVRRTLGVGLALLGAPLLIVLVAPTLSVMTAVGVVRGIGFALAVVAGGALTAALIPAARRGEGLAIVGLVAGIPSLVTLPAGVWVAQHGGMMWVLVVAAIAPLLGLATVPALPRQDAAGEAAHGVLRALRSGALMRPAVVFTASTAAAGAVVTYLPVALAGAEPWVGPAALLAQSATSIVGRWAAGRIGDRWGTARLILPGVLATAVGTGGLVISPGPAVILGAAVLFGLGFGILQNATLTLMYARSTAGAYGVVSAVWNAAYDGGMAMGALVTGLAGALTGLAPAFLLVAVLVAATLILVRHDRRSTR